VRIVEGSLPPHRGHSSEMAFSLEWAASFGFQGPDEGNAEAAILLLSPSGVGRRSRSPEITRATLDRRHAHPPPRPINGNGEQGPKRPASTCAPFPAESAPSATITGLPLALKGPASASPSRPHCGTRVGPCANNTLSLAKSVELPQPRDPAARP